MDIITINKILYKEELRMIENLKKSIALLLSAMLMLMTSLDALFPALSAIAVNDSVVGTENNTENSDNEFYNSDSEVTEIDNENNSVQEYNSDYAVYAESDIPEGDGQSTPYQINTLKQLYWFANEVNVNGNTSINAVLNNNLVVNNNIFNSNGSLKPDTDLEKWTPIGNSSKKYTGTFDGQNHKISGLYFNDDNAENVGLFGYISYGTIKNIGITNSYLKGKKCVGSVCGYSDSDDYRGSQIINCYNNASTVSGSNDYIGGICGYNYKSTIKNNYNTGTVSGSSRIGGICGYNQDGKVLNSYNAGMISGKCSGGICGEAYNGSFLNCYSHSSYKDNVVGAEYYTVTNKNCGVKSSEQFESGEVAYLLGGIWGQKIGTNSMPVLNGEKVYKNVTYKGCGEKNKVETVSSKYSNTEGDTYLNETHNFDNGICTGCGIYELIAPKENNGYYQIENANHLYWFANEVNNGNGSINAVLTADIVVNKNVLNEDGTLNSSSSLVEWTPIGNGKRFSGIFDGQNHTISGLYCNQDANFVGLIGYYKNSSGEIKNVGVIDSYFSGEQAVGGICGTNYGGKIINCYSISTVKGSEAGGICGNNDDSGTIENSYSIGEISGQINVGGICGHNSHYSTVANCYYNSSVYSGKAIGFNSATFDKVEGKTTEQFASGEVAFLLNDEVWGQKIGTDSTPVFNGEPVYQNIIYSGCSKKFPGDCTYSYSNIQADPIYQEHNYENGICTVCGDYEPAPLENGYYQINNAGNLLWFAKQVNNGNTKINAVLTDDIVLNQNLLNADGTLNSNLTDLDLIEWTPIGTYSRQYRGIFDGQNHTISGLYYNNNDNNSSESVDIGLFGWNCGTIKNVGIVDSYFNGYQFVGSLCGFNWLGTITNCYNTSTVNGSLEVGGICGNSNGGIIENSYNAGIVTGSFAGGLCGSNYAQITNCYNIGSVSGTNKVGGICGINGYMDGKTGTIMNCYNTGIVSGSSNVGGICGIVDKGIVTDCYYLENCNADGTTLSCKEGTPKTFEQFANGEVAYSLSGIWGQEIGKDKSPVLNSENKVYKVTAYSSVGNETISEIYTNKSATVTAPVKKGYNFDGWYTYDESIEKLLCSSREYSFDATKDIEVVAVYKLLGTVSITINCDKEYTVNGVSKSSATTESYSIGSTVTLSCNDEDFAYWQNNAGTILSRESEYSFVVTNAETISAVFNEKPEENKATLIFESLYGQVIAIRQLGSGESMEKISVPVRTGYDALGWDFDGDGKYDEIKDKLESAITRGLESGSAVKIVPVYKLSEKTYTINVVNGTGSGEYNENDIVTAVANEIEIEMKFSHWKDSDGNVLSYNEKYVFYASEDMTVEAVYVAMETEINAKGTTNIIAINRTEADKDTGKGKLSFVSMSTVPEGCKINKAGVIATNKSEVATPDKFTDKSAMFVRGMSSNKKAVRYTWTKGNIQTGDKWYVRAYLVYTDSDGNIHTVYSDVVSQEY